MSSISNDDLPSIEQPEEINLTSSGQSKLSYTREYLLSLGELEICTRLPKGFDESLLSVFEISPPQELSRDFQKWDKRPSRRTDSDSQSGRDSDSGRRYDTQSRRSWQKQEHDGLLGSGSFPSSPGYGPGSSVPRSGANDQQKLNRSNDSYHNPRPYKAVSHSWRETKDSFNDETFGSAEDTSEDRVEEERKRKAEFEMMRKEQQKKLNEKLKSKAMGKLKDDPLTELAASLDAGDSAIMTIALDTSVVKPVQQNDSSKVSFSSQGHPSRPVVPPGFANSGAEKISGSKSFGNPLLEVQKLETGDDSEENKSALLLSLDEKHSETAFPWASKSGMKVGLSSAFDLSVNAKDPDGQSLGASNILGISEILDNDKAIWINSKNDSGHKIAGEVGHSTAILEKLFEGALDIKSIGPSNIIEGHVMKADIDLSPKDFHSSKFSQWFPEEEKKPVEIGSSEKPNALLSLIVSENSGLLASETKTTQQILTPDSNLVKMDALVPSDSRVSYPLCNKNRPERNSAVLTCEDLEQSILSGIGGSSSSLHPPGIIRTQHGLENDSPVAGINGNASQHLLSLLQNGIGSNSKAASPISMLDKGSSNEFQDLDSERKIQGHLREPNAENMSSGKGLTLETLFGTSFMKELQSFDAPVYLQRDSSGSSSFDVSQPPMLPVAVSDDGAVNTSVSEARFRRINKDNSISGLGRAHQTNLEKVGRNWSTGDSSQTDLETSHLQRFDVQLPNEFSFNNVVLPVNAQNSMFIADTSSSMKDERPFAGRWDSSPFSRGPFDMRNPEISFQNMHSQSPPQFNPTVMNHGIPSFPPLDPHEAHINQQFNFMPPEGITYQNTPNHHRISADLGHPQFRHPNPGLSEFDHPIHPMLQQMHMPNILPPAPFLPGFPGGAPPPFHHGGNPPGYLQGHNLPHGFPFGQQQPNLVDRRLPLHGLEHGGLDNNPPQSFQRLLEMELRSNQKSMHPSFPSSGGHSRPMYEHELDAGFRHR